MRKIILDCDTGTDDAMAVICAALSPEIELKALTCVRGNLPLPNTVENTLRVVQMLGIDVPVYAGCPEPMVQHLMPGRIMNQRLYPPKYDENGNLIPIHTDYLPLPKATIRPREQHAVSFLVETLRKEKLTVVAVGPGTNVAMALRMDPSIAENIEELVIMGGGVGITNVTGAAEANFYWDPEAAAILLSAKTRVTVMPLNATMSELFSKQDAAEIQSVGTVPAKFFGQLLADFVDRLKALGFEQKNKDGEAAAAIHDALCILYLIDPTIVTDIRHENAFVDFSGGPADGMLFVDTRAGLPLDNDVHIAYKVNRKKIMAMLKMILAHG